MSGDSEIILNYELVRRLCDELRSLINNPAHNDTPPCMEALERYMYEYSKQKFAQKFGFEYDGNRSKPPNSRPEKAVADYKVHLALNGFPASQNMVESWMDAELFERTTRRFPRFAAEVIYDGTRDHILRCGGREGNPSPNKWGTAGFQQIHYDPMHHNRDMQEFSHFLHIHSDLTLDLPNGGSGRIQRTFVYYLGIFSVYVK